MFLAGIIHKYEEEMICDLAEYYSIYDYKSHSPLRVAIFVKGLRSNSRVITKLSKIKTGIREDVLLTAIFDNLNWLVWSKTKDGQKGKNKPKSLMNSLFGEISNDKNKKYTSSKDFKKERERILESIRKGAKYERN